MNKKMRELLDLIKSKAILARKFQDEGKFEEARKVLDDMDKLQGEYENEKAIYEYEKSNIPEGRGVTDKVDGFKLMAKLARKAKLSDAENAALVTAGEDDGTENLIVPEDVNLTIKELRRSYMSAKSLVNVVPTSTLTGSFLYEKGEISELDNFSDDDTELADADKPQFENKKWSISWYGNTLPVSNILLGAEKSGLTSYLNRMFVRKAIITENKKIFETLKNGKKTVSISGLAALKSSMNKDLDPSCLINGVIITNQTGFDIMDSETDANGRPLLQNDMKNPTQKIFNGLRIIVFSDKLLPNESEKAPIFYGDINAGITFIEKEGLQFAVSEHIFFRKNQIGIRVMEGFDVFQADSDAYSYGLFSRDSE